MQQNNSAEVTPIQNDLLMFVAIAAVTVGAGCGGLIVFGLFVFRSRILASSLTHSHRLAGRVGTVQVAFDYRSKGKIILSFSSSTRELLAITDYPNAFAKGDRVLVVQVSKSHAWVVPIDMFDSS